MPPAIHITGASGSGTTTLGRTLATRLDSLHLDTDDFYWAPVEPKFSVKRAPADRVNLIEQAIATAGGRGFVLSGSISEWGAPLVPRFRLVVFMAAPTDVRIARLRRRETEMFGASALAPGGARNREFEAFIDWASAYDDNTRVGRSRFRHEAWLDELSCPVLRVDGTEPSELLVEKVVDVLPRAAGEC